MGTGGVAAYIEFACIQGEAEQNPPPNAEEGALVLHGFLRIWLCYILLFSTCRTTGRLFHVVTMQWFHVEKALCVFLHTLHTVLLVPLLTFSVASVESSRSSQWANISDQRQTGEAGLSASSAALSPVPRPPPPMCRSRDLWPECFGQTDKRGTCHHDVEGPTKLLMLLFFLFEAGRNICVTGLNIFLFNTTWKHKAPPFEG